MRKTALLGLALAAASLVPVTSASASCVAIYQQVTGQCSPCPAVQRAYDNARHKTGDVLPPALIQCID